MAVDGMSYTYIYIFYLVHIYIAPYGPLFLTIDLREMVSTGPRPKLSCTLGIAPTA